MYICTRNMGSAMFTATLTWLHVSDYKQFELVKDGSLLVHRLAQIVNFTVL